MAISSKGDAGELFDTIRGVLKFSTGDVESLWMLAKRENS